MLKLTHNGQEHIVPIGGRVRLSDGRILVNVQPGEKVDGVTIEAYKPPEPEPQEPEPQEPTELELLREELNTLKAKLVEKKVVTAAEIKPERAR